MNLRLIEATTDEQFGRMIPSFWDALDNPRNAGKELLYPVKGDGAEAVAEAKEDCRKRMTADWKNSRSVCHCLQILDSHNSDVVVGAALWNIYNSENNPFIKFPPDGHPTVDVDWQPNGSTIQKFTKIVREQQIPLRLQRQRRPHLYLGMCFTDINYRRQGVAGMLMEWGINKADELGVECFLESTSIAVPLYQRFEYLIIDENEITAPIPNPSEEWKDLEKRYLPICSTNMWRPVEGKYEEGTKYPWEVEI